MTERRDFKLSATPATLDVKGDVAIEPRYRGIFKVNGYVLKARLVAAWNDGAALVPRGAARRLAPALRRAGDVRRPRRLARRAQRGDADRRRRRAGARRHAARRPSARLSRRRRRVVRRRAPAAARRGRHRARRHRRARLRAGRRQHPGRARLGLAASVVRRPLPADRAPGRRDRLHAPAGSSTRWRRRRRRRPPPARRRAASTTASATRSPREDGRRTPCVETFGVAFIDPVSPYVLSDRATKYGLLFIALTFVGVGAVEVHAAPARAPDPVPARRLGHRRLLPAAGEPVRARAVRGRLSRRRRRVHGAARRSTARSCCAAAAPARSSARRSRRSTARSTRCCSSSRRRCCSARSCCSPSSPALMVATRRIDWYGLFERMRAQSRAPAAAATRRARRRRGAAAETPRPPPRASTRQHGEDLLQRVRRDDLELVVAAALRRLVGPPAHEGRRVAEAVALQVVVLHLADALDAQRLPRQVLAGAPAAGRAGHALRRVAGRRVLAAASCSAQSRQGWSARASRRSGASSCASCAPRRHRERRRHADVMEDAGVVVQAEQERADRLGAAFLAALVPAKAGDDAVGACARA